jgi:hypothetical protein
MGHLRLLNLRIARVTALAALACLWNGRLAMKCSRRGVTLFIGKVFMAKKKSKSKKAMVRKSARAKSGKSKAAVKRKPAVKSKPAAKRRSPAKPNSKGTRRVRRGRAVEGELVAYGPRGLGARSAGQSGDTQGIGARPDVDSESVEELLEEGQAFEAEVLDGVENVPDPDQGEVRTREVEEDDVPEEYRDKDSQS